MAPERIKIVLDCLRELSREHARNWNPLGNDDGLKGIHNLGTRHCLEDAIALINELIKLNAGTTDRVPEGWEIDIKSTGTPILTYNKCSVIQDEQAYFVMRAIQEYREAAMTDCANLSKTALLVRIRQFQFCIDRVAEALGNVCCGGVDSSHAEQLSDPHSTTRVLCDAIEKLKADALGEPVGEIRWSPLGKTIRWLQDYSYPPHGAKLYVATPLKRSQEKQICNERDFCESLKNRDGL